MHEIKLRCDRFVIIHSGRVVLAGTRDEVVGNRRDLEEAFFAALVPDDLCAARE
ncbi:MAG: hypothetical protein NTY87_12335 [Planctomycetia bacterium]|nr:hypothetical protein [Planctomycetia bacterium]